MKKVLLGVLMVVSLGVTPLLGASSAQAAYNPVGESCGEASAANSPLCQHTGDDGTKEVKNIVNLLLYALGIIAVIVIIIGGIRYTTSGGDAAAVKGAKDTILYAVVGLVIAILAYAIVNFVVTWFK